MEASVAFRSHLKQAVITFFAQGENPATAELYEGETLLVTLTLAEPCGAVTPDGQLALFASLEGMIMVTGNANRCLFKNGAGDQAWESTVSDLNGEGEARVESTTLYAGAYTRLIGGILA